MRRNIFFIIAAFFLGSTMGYLYHDYEFHKLPDTWFEVPNVLANGEKGSVGYSSAAIFGVEIPLPELKSISSKAKFFDSRSGKKNAELGYIVSIDVEKLDISKLPEKYLKDRPVPNSTTWVIPPLEQVIYEIHMEFILFDKDGFQLAHLSGPKHSIESGKINTFQDVVLKPISYEIAKRTTSIQPKVSIEKCLSCE